MKSKVVDFPKQNSRANTVTKPIPHSEELKEALGQLSEVAENWLAYLGGKKHGTLQQDR